MINNKHLIDENIDRNDENMQLLKSIRNIVSGERGAFIDKIIKLYNDGAFDD